MYTKPALIGGSVLAISTFASLSVFAAVGSDTTALRDAVTIDGVRAHQAAFQAIADANGGTRASGTPGYDASADYVANAMAAAGYNVTRQSFDYSFYQTNSVGALDQLAPVPTSYTYLVDYFDMSYSGSADVSGPGTAVDLDLGLGNTSTSGCEAADFDGFPAGNIAIIQRGACSFAQKATNAFNAGAAGAIIFNQGDAEGRDVLFGGTLGEGFTLPIPVVSMTYDLGVELAETPEIELRLWVDSEVVTSTTENIIADTVGGRDDRVVVVGAHLDSVPEGPGIQDNGSGSAAILEVALQLAESDIEPRNKVRFAWWGAEESGLIGSQFYVDQLTPKEIKKIALNLNFDMIASPNFMPFVYDGDGSATGISGPNGSGNIERIFVDFFDENAPWPSVPTEFSGRSDYGPFIDVGIPAGGLFTGAEGIKTDEEAAIYGGTAGDQYDPCYHLACDTFDNVSLEIFDIMADAVAHSVQIFATTTSAVNGTDKASNVATTKAQGNMEWLSGKLQR